MLTGIHFLLTYRCNFECDHCSLYCSPRSKGTFTIEQVTQVLDEAKKIGITTSSISIEPPEVQHPSAESEDKGNPVVGGGARFRGRAVEKLAHDLPTKPWEELRECPYEDLISPDKGCR
jgi:hypothetical protein